MGPAQWIPSSGQRRESAGVARTPPPIALWGQLVSCLVSRRLQYIPSKVAGGVCKTGWPNSPHLKRRYIRCDTWKTAGSPVFWGKLKVLRKA